MNTASDDFWGPMMAWTLYSSSNSIAFGKGKRDNVDQNNISGLMCNSTQHLNQFFQDRKNGKNLVWTFQFCLVNALI
jgi:hypothetical protein